MCEGELSPVVEGKSSRDLNIGSGWTGDGYGEVRASAPFAILDDIYLSMERVAEVDNGVNFPPLTVNWSVDNVPTYGDLNMGQIGTSYYNNGEMYILGDANFDTDEFVDPCYLSMSGDLFWGLNYLGPDSIRVGPHPFLGDKGKKSGGTGWEKGFGNMLGSAFFSRVIPFTLGPLGLETSKGGKGKKGENTATKGGVIGGGPFTRDFSWAQYEGPNKEGAPGKGPNNFVWGGERGGGGPQGRPRD